MPGMLMSTIATMGGPARTMSLQDYRSVMGVNFWGAVHTTLAALPHLRRSALARIVNVTSIGGAIPVPHLLPYTCSKFAMVGFSEGLAVELAPHRITCNALSPGAIDTQRAASAGPRPVGDRPIPLKRFGTIEEIAAMVRLLVGPEGTFITGQTINVDGGFAFH